MDWWKIEKKLLNLDIKFIKNISNWLFCQRGKGQNIYWCNFLGREQKFKETVHLQLDFLWDFFHLKYFSSWQVDTSNQIIMALSFICWYLAPPFALGTLFSWWVVQSLTMAKVLEYIYFRDIRCKYLCQMPMTYIIFCQLKYLMQAFWLQ